MTNNLSADHLRQEVTVTLPLGVVLRLADQPAPAAAASPTRFADLPTIGTPWQGGIYAGLSVSGERPVALILLPGDESLPWKDAGEWAEKQGGVRPSRIDQLVLFKNLKSEFKEAWYWSDEQYAGNEGCAWFQYFGYGFQDSGHKGSKCRVRAVRRLPIQ